MKFKFVQSNEQLMTHTGLTTIGALIAKTNLATQLNQDKLPDNPSPDISNADVFKSYIMAGNATWKALILDESADLLRRVKAPLIGLDVFEPEQGARNLLPLDIDVSPDRQFRHQEGRCLSHLQRARWLCSYLLVPWQRRIWSPCRIT